jgi:hypothetical protein
VTALAPLLSRLSTLGLSLELRGDQISVRPADRLTTGVRQEIIENRSAIIELLRQHGPDLVSLFRDAPTWPPARGRCGPAGRVWNLLGKTVLLTDGQEGILRLADYDTRTGRVRCRVDLPNGWKLVDPEDVRPSNGS